MALPHRSRPAFPGMNPYLEDPSIWPEVHTGLIWNMGKALNAKITPKYRAAVEKRVYSDALLIGIPDVAVYQKSAATPPKETASQQTATAILSQPEQVTLPILSEIRERFIEIREAGTGRVVTVVEILSPANKRPGEGRKQYLAKRQNILNSNAHLVEIDLLRSGEAMPTIGGRDASYQVIVSRTDQRPSAERYAFGLQDPLPCFLLPLDADAAEPAIYLKQLLDQACEDAALDSAIDYAQAPKPPLSDEDETWMRFLRKLA